MLASTLRSFPQLLKTVNKWQAFGHLYTMNAMPQSDSARRLAREFLGRKILHPDLDWEDPSEPNTVTKRYSVRELLGHPDVTDAFRGSQKLEQQPNLYKELADSIVRIADSGEVDTGLLRKGRAILPHLIAESKDNEKFMGRNASQEAARGKSLLVSFRQIELPAHGLNPPSGRGQASGTVRCREW